MAAKPPFKFWSFLFSLRGRVSRRAYALFELPATALLLLVGQVAIPAIMMAMANRAHTDLALINLLMGLSTVLNFALMWPRFAVLVKRMHDAGLPWFCAATLLLPLALAPLAYFDGMQVVRSGYYHPTALTYALGVANIGLFWLNLALIIGFSFIPTRSAGHRYGPDPRRTQTASDIF